MIIPFPKSVPKDCDTGVNITLLYTIKIFKKQNNTLRKRMYKGVVIFSTMFSSHTLQNVS